MYLCVCEGFSGIWRIQAGSSMSGSGVSKYGCVLSSSETRGSTSVGWREPTNFRHLRLRKEERSLNQPSAHQHTHTFQTFAFHKNSLHSHSLAAAGQLKRGKVVSYFQTELRSVGYLLRFLSSSSRASWMHSLVETFV